ncbi:hypothetical protein AAV94_07880 [Lampropedia cohaerens]|uniref:DUF1330 domain-containing protein n=1 Tax=Lampropedia cohaerens TaxID=1610491 RepID=A0A0U1PZZ1_9BURK|nr:DUF1330 domain-containing protein [Lampropedia cohaerens]KKW68057.1 hypothetical protein AAV94_07880 [Lampropedia cohaerens]
MPAYWIAHVDVHDPQQYRNYTDLAPEAFRKYGAKFLARGGKSQTLEGPAFERNVVIEFPDFQAAIDCYNSAEYQLAKTKRIGHAVSQVTIVEGLQA